MKEKTSTLIVVQFKKEGHPAPEYYSSVVALYRKHTREELGAVIGTIYNAIHKDNYFDGPKVYIRKEKVTHATQQKK